MLIKKFLKWRRRGKQRCARCYSWKDDALMESSWCKVCTWRQTAFVCELIGSVLTARCLRRDDYIVEDLVKAALHEFRLLPPSEEKSGLGHALWIAENYSVDVSTTEMADMIERLIRGPNSLRPVGEAKALLEKVRHGNQDQN